MASDAMMSVAFNGDDGSPARAQRLFSLRGFAVGGQGPNYDVVEDGRFIMIRVAQYGPQRQLINVVLNWFEELKERVPTGR